MTVFDPLLTLLKSHSLAWLQCGIRVGDGGRAMIAAVIAAVAVACAATSTAQEDGQARHDRAEASRMRYYPAKALDAGVPGGRAVLDCFVDAEGWLRDCKVASEEPPDYDFGDGALHLAPLFHMKTGLCTRVEIPIKFKLPE